MDTTKLVIPPGGGPTWEMAPGRSAALKITSDMAQSVMMFEEVAPTDTVTDLHIHHDSDEIAYVLSGEVTFKIGDQITVGGPGTCAFMPRGVPHAWKRYLAPRPDVFCSCTLLVTQAASSRRPCAIIVQ